MGLLAWLLGLVACVVLCRYTSGARSLEWTTGRDGVAVGRFGSSSDRPQLIGFGVAVPRGIEFECRRETALDKWFYRLGVGRDTAVGSDIDGIVHLACTSPSLVAALRADPSLRALVRQLVYAVDAGGYKNLGLSCREGRLEVLYRRAGNADPARLQRLVMPRLQALQAALPQPAAVMPWAAPRTGNGDYSDWLVALCQGLLLNSVLQLVRLVFTDSTWTLERGPMMLTGLGFSVVLFVVLLYAVLRSLAASPRLTTVLFAAVFSGGIGCLLSGWSLARDINIAFDFSRPDLHQVKVVARNGAGRRGRHSTTYLVPGYGRYRIFGRPPGMLVVGDVRRGALGFAWIDDLRAAGLRDIAAAYLDDEAKADEVMEMLRERMEADQRQREPER